MAHEGPSRPVAPDAEQVKLIFLDVDGVLNTSDSVGYYPLHVSKLDFLKSIVDVTDAKVVVSSSWREDEKAMTVLKKELSKRSIDCIGITKKLNWDSKRTDQIRYFIENFSQDFANKKQIHTWVAVDDFELDEMDSELMKDHFVQTDVSEGLTEKHSQKAIELLNCSSR